MELVQTIEDDEDAANYSDSSADEDYVAQPQTKEAARIANNYFQPDFNFVSCQAEYVKDTWNDLAKYVKRKPNTSLDDKIANCRKQRKRETQDEEEKEDEDDDDISEDELVHDKVHVKKKDAKRKIRKQEKLSGECGIEVKQEEAFFEEPVPYDESASFYAMNLSRPLLKAIETMQFVHPTPIQAATIPVALAGRDICGCAATGTGKTAAYMLPILERLLYRPKEASPVTRVLALVPTRELGVQVYQVSRQLAQFSTIEFGLAIGGLDLNAQEAILRRNPDIVIATPGRLIDHLKNTASFSLESIEVLILDEADRMLAECFLDQMKEIVRSCAPTRQTLLFSATMSDEVNDLVTVSLKKPVRIFVDSNRVAARNLRQEFVRIRQVSDSNEDTEKYREAILACLVRRTFRDHTMVFIQTKQQCHRLHILLGLLGIRVGELHGNLSQPQRLEALKLFKEEQIDVLLATDVAARGLDIIGVKSVINYTLPVTLEHYIHRVGRTARAGRAGVCCSLVDEDQRHLLRDIVKSARDPVKVRSLPTQIIAKYRQKLLALEDDVKRILNEERAEREIAGLENRANRLENKLKDEKTVPRSTDRAWFQKRTKNPKFSTHKKSKINDERVKKRTVTNTQKKKVEALMKDGDEEKNFLKETQFQAREAKRRRKQTKIRTVKDNATGAKRIKNGGGGRRMKTKSAFDTDVLTNIDRKSIKKFRHKGGRRQKTKS